MTSFNHYALGAVADWMHSTVAGLSLAEPGWRKIRFEPRPGGTITHAGTYHITPYGRAGISWRIKDRQLQIDMEVPPNTTAELVIHSADTETLGSGFHSRVLAPWLPDKDWPPQVLGNHFNQVQAEDTLAS